MSDDLEIPFDRITYRDGQLLASRDRRDDRRRADRLRWLHTRYLHETWGIALGFEVRPAVGDAAVMVGPGFAVDSNGCDIVLSEGIEIPVPTTNGPTRFVLTMSYLDDPDFRDRAYAADLCVSGSLDPRNERPAFWWQEPLDVRFGAQVPIVSVTVASGKIQGALDFRVRRNARRLVRPHMGWGSKELGVTDWQSKKIIALPFAFLETTVDTSEAGFTTVPHYFAFLSGDFPGVPFGTLPPPPPGSAVAAVAPSLDGCTFITDATRDRFAYRIIIGAGMPLGTVTSALEAVMRRWRITWLGLEPVTGCAPAFRLSRFFSLAGALRNVGGGS